MKTHIEDLKTKGFVVLAYPKDLRQAVTKAVKSWKKFCDLPQKIKKVLPYSNVADGVGYELKEGVGNKADRKENFDIALLGNKWLTDHVGEINNPIALSFVENATKLVSIMKSLILDFASKVEQSFDVKDFCFEIEGGEDVFFVRFIHYFGDRKVGEETATAHTDQSGFTLHLYESAPGLECLTHDGKWIPMPVSEGETVIIPCMQMQLRSAGKLKALCHRVVATHETAREGRYSAVCFVQLKNTPKYNKERHGRLQEKKPGFNYKLSHGEFQKLFK